MNILYVCTANVCRSPSAEFLMRDAAGALGIRDVRTSSAGVRAATGISGCEVATALRGRHASHRSRRLSPDAVQWADLILTAARNHLRHVNDLAPGVRTRTFTIRQAGRVAGWMLRAGLPAAGRQRAVAGPNWSQSLRPDDPLRGVLALTDDWQSWLLEEMDAARGFAPIPPGASPDDIQDPHEGESAWHVINYQQLWQATNDLAMLIKEVQTTSSHVRRA